MHQTQIKLEKWFYFLDEKVSKQKLHFFAKGYKIEHLEWGMEIFCKLYEKPQKQILSCENAIEHVYLVLVRSLRL